jgi:hypothetical protein
LDAALGAILKSAESFDWKNQWKAERRLIDLWEEKGE